MAVALAQAIVFAGGSGTSQAFSLGGAPTPGNEMVIAFMGNDNAVAPGGFSVDVDNVATSNAAIYLCHRIVQAGDTAGPYSYTGLSSGYDGGGFIAEFSGAGLPIVDASGNAAWTLIGTTMVSAGTINTLAGSMGFAFYNVYTGATTIAQGADTINQSFAVINHGPLSTSASNKSYQLIASRSDASPTTANPTATMPNITVASSQQSQLNFSIPPASGSSGNAGTAACIGNSGLIPPAFPRRFIIGLL